MYLDFYGLSELPFEIAPNPDYLFLTPKHREALSNLQYGLFSGKALTVLMGEAGTGKTTLLRAALESDRCQNVRCVYINNPTLTRDEFVRMLATRFELGPEAAQSKTVLLSSLELLIGQRRTQGEITALVVDEAQSLSDELLEEIRLLANLETSTEKLLPLVLAGQPALRDRLNNPTLLQLKQRVTLRCEIAPFVLSETAAYISSRIKKAGGDPRQLFTREAVQLVHEYAGGIPRTVNVICDNALVAGMAMQQRLVSSDIVLEVCRDFDLLRSADDFHGAGTHMGVADEAAPSSESPDESAEMAGTPTRRGSMFKHAAARGFALLGSRR